MKYFYRIADDRIIRGSGTKIPEGFDEYDPANKPDDLIAYEQIERATSLIDDAQRIADDKTRAAKAYLAEKESLSIEQEQRYREKYDAAKAYLDAPDDATAALFAAEADAAGLSVDELCQLIVETGDAWAAAVRSYAIMIDSGRVAVGKLVDAGELDAAQSLLDQLSELGPDATPEQVADLVAAAMGDSA